MRDMTESSLPDAEACLAGLIERMRDEVAVDAVLVGIYSGGAWLAERLAAALPGDHAVAFLDVSLHRDDYARRGLKPGGTTSLPFPVDGSHIILVDDVLYTGRSVRAAINELYDYGRPDRVELAVLVDRGGRELPIEATWVGARVAVVRSMTIALERAADGRLALSVQPAGSGADD
jgi:pyrimidine operon attenuation protein/uracil phosphoribosyltransferase